MIFDMTVPDDVEELHYERANCLLGAWLAVTYGVFDFTYLKSIRQSDAIHIFPTRPENRASMCYFGELLRRARDDHRIVLLPPTEDLRRDLDLIIELRPLWLATTEREVVWHQVELREYVPNIHIFEVDGSPITSVGRPILGPDGQPINVPAAL